MWSLFQEAKTWGKTPSELFSLEGEYAIFCFNEAVAMIGNHIQNELEGITGKTASQTEGRRLQALRRLLGQAPQFRAPVATRKA